MNNNSLKLIASIAMLIDHIGIVFFEDIIIFRLIGRIAFPIFAYYIALGFSQTSNLKRYIVRVITFSILSQIPFYFLYINYDYIYLNTLFTFSLALLSLYFLNKNNILFSLFIALFPSILAYFLPIQFDYGSYGILMVLSFYLFRDKLFIRNLAIVMLSFFYVIIDCLIENIPLHYLIIHPQVYCSLSLLLLERNYKFKIHLPKYFFYYFYPIHILIIIIINYLYI